MKWRKGWKQDKRRKKPSVEAGKLLRCIGMIHFLKSAKRTIKEISQRFDISTRTVYRYFILFEEVGYCIERDFSGRIFIFGEPKF